MHLSGFLGWLVWLFIHIAFLTGYRNRAGAILTWWVAFTRDVRRERAVTSAGPHHTNVQHGSSVSRRGATGITRTG